MIEPRDPASSPAWMPKAAQRQAAYRAAIVSGEAFTSDQWAEWDKADLFDPNIPPSHTRKHGQPPIVGEFTELDLAQVEMTPGELEHYQKRLALLYSGEWLPLKNSFSEGHHSFQWSTKNSIKNVVNFTEIANCDDGRLYRATLELARLCAKAEMTGDWSAVVTLLPTLLLPNWDQLHNPRGNLSRMANKTAFKLSAMCAKTGVYSTFTLNFGTRKLNKYQGKGKKNGKDAWHKRMTTSLRGKLGGLSFMFAVERDHSARWHVHGIVFGIDQETFEEQYSAALKQVGGEYTSKAQKHQLKIDGGYGFDRMLGWIGYCIKTGATLYEPQSITQAGKALYEKAQQQAAKARTSSKTKVLEKTPPHISGHEETDTVILKSPYGASEGAVAQSEAQTQPDIASRLKFNRE